MARLQAHVIYKGMELTAARLPASRSSKALVAITLIYVSLRSELDAMHAAGDHLDVVLRDFVENACTGYSGLMRRYATGYCNCFEAFSSAA